MNIKTAYNNFSLLILSLLLFQYKGKAQVDSLKIYDLAVTIEHSTTQGQPVNILMLSAFFKVNNPDSISRIYVKIGINQNTSEFKSDSLIIVKHGATNCMHTPVNEICAFWNKSTRYRTEIPVSFTNVNWFTIYAKDKHGNYSAKKYFKIQ